jgi:DNA-directed RNA polymerase I, II, and III subunit RPABC2
MSDNEDYDESNSESESGSESEPETIKPFIKLKGSNEIVDAVDVEDVDDDDDDVEDDDDDDDDDNEDDDEDSFYQQEIEEEKNEEQKGKKNEEQKGKKNETQKGKKNEENPIKINEEDKNNDSDNDEETDEHYLQKFDIDINKNYLIDVHPECLHHNYDEIEILTVIIRDSNNIIIDPLHKTISFLTKYERARILGQRAKQINMGAQSFIKIPDNVIDGIIIAELELKQKKIPFIIKRPLPNGACEYWNVNDLENILY